MVNTYDLGGGRVLSSLLKAPLHPNNLGSIATVCVVLDLSKPGNLVDSLLFWLHAVKKQLKVAHSELERTNQAELKKLLLARETYCQTLAG